MSEGGAVPEVGISRRAHELALLVDSVRDYAIFLLDPTGTIADLERRAPSASRATRPTRSSAGTSRCSTPSEDRERGRPSASSDRARATGRFEDEGWRVRKDGTRFWASVVITALRDERRRSSSASARSRAT